ncbi:MAG: lactate utilization protein [Chloroflexi bacterium]|nr:lactate utilization protein [Chloroflexota bacterium]
MKQSDFLARFKSAPTVSPRFERADAARWVAEFHAGLPAQQAALVAQFRAALEGAGGVFRPARDAAEAAAIALEIAQAHSARTAVAWSHPALDAACAALAGAGIGVTRSEQSAGLDRAQIRAATVAADIGLTACEVAIAQTGTLLLVHHERHGRLTGLAPITHIAIIDAGQLVPELADALKLLRLARLDGDGRLPSNISLHTGPSKTADVEQTLTKGVHGPKEVHVICVGG